jgi:heme-degrading monooxygenase HmoA
MFIATTIVKGAPQQISETEKFLYDFLPKLKKFPGVISVYNYNLHDKGESNTIVIWENEDAVKAYLNSELIKEPKEFVKNNNSTLTRESNQLFIALNK